MTGARRSRPWAALLSVAGVCVVALAAGCGGSSADGTTSGATVPTAPATTTEGTTTTDTTTTTARPPLETPEALAERGYQAVWRADFESGDDGRDFSSPEGTSNGECRREVRDGAAYYVWLASDEDGGSTRCYPNEVFSDEEDGERIGEVDAPWIFSGRFYVDMARPEQVQDGFLSLITFQPAVPEDRPGGAENAWTSVVTINLSWEEDWESPRLNIFHVPGHGEGRYRRRSDAEFPLGRWVDLRVEWDEDNDIEVYQDGELLITAQKTEGRDGDFEPQELEVAELHGMHFGGYASDSVQQWVIGNDDLVVAVPEAEAQRRRDAGL